MNWVEQELKTIDLGDQRLNERAVKVLERLTENPSSSLPRACSGWAELQATYRFFQNEKTGWEELLSPHWHSTNERIRQEPIVLAIQDTTELNYHGQDIEGLGPLSYEAQRGYFLHANYAVTPERVPLGVLDAWMWTREFKDAKGQRGGVLESTRWVESYARLCEQAALHKDVRFVHVGDRESDMLSLLIKARDLGYPADYLLRSCHNRVLPQKDKLWNKIGQTDALGCIRFQLPGGRGWKARTVTQEIRVSRERLSDRKKGKNKGHVEVTCLIASEVNTPAKCKPVVWRLLTNREVSSLEEAIELIDWYRARWEIEIFFLILKEGCRVEQFSPL